MPHWHHSTAVIFQQTALQPENGQLAPGQNTEYQDGVYRAQNLRWRLAVTVRAAGGLQLTSEVLSNIRRLKDIIIYDTVYTVWTAGLVYQTSLNDMLSGALDADRNAA